MARRIRQPKGSSKPSLAKPIVISAAVAAFAIAAIVIMLRNKNNLQASDKG